MNQLVNKGVGYLALLLFFSLAFFAQSGAAPLRYDSSAYRDEIKKINENILFERNLDKNLTDAKVMLLAFTVANSVYGKTNLKVNKKLEPFFQVDTNGNLLWGSALQLLSVQQQFLPTGAAALTPEGAKEALDGMQTQNRAALEKNVQRLQTLKAEADAQKAEESAFAAQLQELSSQLIKVMQSVRDIQKAKRDFAEAQFQYNFVLARLKNAENMAQKGIQVMAQLAAGRIFIGQYLQDFDKDTKNLARQIEQFEKEPPFSQIEEGERQVAQTICNSLESASGTPPPAAQTVSKWTQKAGTLIAEAEASRKKASEERTKMREAIRFLLSALQDEMAAMQQVDREKFSAGLQELQRMERSEKLGSVFQDTRELEKLVSLMNDTINVAPNLSFSVRNIIKKATALAEAAPKGNDKLRREALQLKGQADNAWDELETAKAENRIQVEQARPETTEVSSDLKKFITALQEKKSLDPGPLFRKIDTALAQGKEAVTASNEVLRKADPPNANELDRARNCYASLKNIPTQQLPDGGEKETVDSPQVVSRLQQIIAIGQPALPYAEGWSGESFTNTFPEAQKSCEAAGKFREKMLGQVELVLKAEEQVQLMLRTATAIADKCPVVKNPQNIIELHNSARQLAGNISAEKAAFQADNAKLNNEIFRAKQTRNRALQKWSFERNFILEISNKVTPLWESVRTEMTISDTPSALWKEARGIVKWIQSQASVWRQATEESINAKYPECPVQAADSMVDAVENAFAAVLINLAAADNLPDRAAACKSVDSGVPEANDSDNDGVADNKDRCFDTPAGAQVGPDGCIFNPFESGDTDWVDATVENEENRSQNKAEREARQRAASAGNRYGSSEIEKDMDAVSQLPVETPASRDTEEPISPPESDGTPSTSAQPEPTDVTDATDVADQDPNANNGNQEDISPPTKDDAEPSKTTEKEPTNQPATQPKQPTPTPPNPTKTETQPVAPPVKTQRPPNPAPPAQPPATSPVTNYVGTWRFSGTRKDGVKRDGNMEFAFNGALAYTVIDRDTQPKGNTGTGRWKAELRGGKVYLTLSNIQGKTWEGFPSGSINQFTLSKTAHGTYTFTKIR